MGIDWTRFFPLLTKRPGHTRQASSYGRDPDRGSDWCGLRPRPAFRKRILLKPNETHVMADLDHPGVITRIWMTAFPLTNRHALRDVVLRFYWDGESKPSVECPFGDFFGVPFGNYISYIAQPMSFVSRAGCCYFPMPFASGARLEITNEGPKTVEPFFYQVTYYELEEEPETPLRFHAQWRRENTTQPDMPYTILDAVGEGHYVGCHLFMLNRSWWLRSSISQMAFPYGMGMGMLEGWESIFVDGETTPSVIGTGTEDYFSGAWYYFWGGTFNAPYHGCTVRDYLRGRVAIYRFDVQAPTPFQNSLQVFMDHGFENKIVGDYSSVAYWYQTEPHRPFPLLPDRRASQTAASFTNLLQAGFFASAVLIFVTTLLKLFSLFTKKR